MSDENNELQSDPNKLHQDIEDLRLKYKTLSEDVTQLENNKATISTDIKQIHNEFEQINKNVGEILQKLSKLSDGFVENENKMEAENVPKKFMKNMFTNPLRKLAIGMLSAVYTVADKTIEKTSNVKESLEDIVAEAKYANKKSKMESAESS
ncbi:MAG: hypothetical protein H7X94_00910 [Vallitaleaceae bacterium]|nr:hypothetical protein [Vallitaleaceae bacterium]